MNVKSKKELDVWDIWRNSGIDREIKHLTVILIFSLWFCPFCLPLGNYSVTQSCQIYLLQKTTTKKKTLTYLTLNKFHSHERIQYLDVTVRHILRKKFLMSKGSFALEELDKHMLQVVTHLQICTILKYSICRISSDFSFDSMLAC